MSIGIDNRDLARITALFDRHPKIREAIIFGSRAKGSFRAGSDLDIALKGDNMTFSELSQLENAYAELDLPWKLDLVIYDQIRNSDLKDHIDRVGILIYARCATVATLA